MLRDINPKNILVTNGPSSDRTVEAANDTGAQAFFQNGIGKSDAIAKAVKHD
jgi:hypothetical protein